MMFLGVLCANAETIFSRETTNSPKPAAMSLSRYKLYKTNFLSFWGNKGEKIAVTFKVADSEGYVFEYQISTPAGTEVEKGIIPSGERRTIDFIAAEEGPYIIKCDSFGNDYTVDVGNRPWVFAVKGNRKPGTCFWGPYNGDPMYFYLPADSKEMAWYMGTVPSGAKVKLISPSGKIYHEEKFDKDTYFTNRTINIPTEDRDGVWCWETASVPRFLGNFMGNNVGEFYSTVKENVKFYADRIYHNPDALGKQGIPFETGSVKEEAWKHLRGDFTESLSWDEPEYGTRRPLIQMYDGYSRDLFENTEEYINRIRPGRPNILNVIRNIPFQSSWGPLKGENDFITMSPQLTFTADEPRPPSPEEMERRIKRMREVFDRIHGLGVPNIQGYVNSTYIAVDPDKGKSIDAVYNQWDEYNKVLDLGPPPLLPPEEWVRRAEDGSPQLWLRGKWLGNPDFISTSACPNNPGYRRWMEVVAILTARAGLDSLHLDSPSKRVCFCKYCREKYSKYLGGKYSPAQLKDLFGFEKESDINLSDDQKNKPLLRAESIKFMCRSMGGLYKTMVEAGETVKGRGRFMVDVSYPPLPYEMPENIYSGMMERGSHFHGLNELAFFNGKAVFRYIEDFVFDQKTSLSAARSIPGPKRTRLSPHTARILGASEYTARLSCAESAAFGDGSICFVGPHFPYIFQMYQEFFNDHQEVYGGCFSASKIAVLINGDYYGDDCVINYPIHETYSRLVLATLLENQAPADVVNAYYYRAEDLKQYRLLFAANYKYVSKSELNDFYNYAQSGGTLVISADFARMDEYFKERTGQFPWNKNIGEPNAYAVDYGKGRVILTGALIERENVKGLLTSLFPALPRLAVDANGTPPFGLRSAVYHKDSGRKKTCTIHLVNYNVLNENGIYDYTAARQYNAQPSKPRKLANLKVRLNLKEMGWDKYKLKEARLSSPDFEISPGIKSEQKGDVVEINIPELYIYGIIELALKR